MIVTKTYKIKFDEPSPGWLNQDNLSTALHSYCKGTEFEVSLSGNDSCMKCKLNDICVIALEINEEVLSDLKRDPYDNGDSALDLVYKAIAQSCPYYEQ